MIAATGRTFVETKFGKPLIVSEAKNGKTAYLVAQSLGVFPGQTQGGLVDHPSNLHVVGVDTMALDKLRDFLLKTCKAPENVLDFHTYNWEEDARATADRLEGDEYTFANKFLMFLRDLDTKYKGTSVLVISSITGLAQALERSMKGAPMGDISDRMSIGRWMEYGRLMTEIRNVAQRNTHHTLWESHIYKPQPSPMAKKSDAPPTEELEVLGQPGRGYAQNVSHIFRLRRVRGQVVKGTTCDQMFLDTRPTGDFIPGGRGVTELLSAQEPDMVVAFQKLGLQVGGWKATGTP